MLHEAGCYLLRLQACWSAHVCESRAATSRGSDQASAADTSRKVWCGRGGVHIRTSAKSFRDHLHPISLTKWDPAPSCILEITENRVVIARNSRLVECGLLPSREMVDVEISGSPNNLTVFQQKTKGTNKYTLQRTESGRWVITNVEVVYPRDNVAAGDVEVVRATADLKFTPVLVNQYSPASIKERMVQSIVQ